jgi:hypothetical protein
MNTDKERNFFRSNFGEGNFGDSQLWSEVLDCGLTWLGTYDSPFRFS